MLERFLNRAIQVGRLQVIDGRGRASSYGDGSGPEVVVRLKPGAALKLALNPDLKLGECYMDGDLVLERGEIYDLMDLIGRNMARSGRPIRSPWRAAWRLSLPIRWSACSAGR